MDVICGSFQLDLFVSLCSSFVTFFVIIYIIKFNLNLDTSLIESACTILGDYIHLFWIKLKKL